MDLALDNIAPGVFCFMAHFNRTGFAPEVSCQDYNDDAVTLELTLGGSPY